MIGYTVLGVVCILAGAGGVSLGVWELNNCKNALNFYWLLKFIVPCSFFFIIGLAFFTAVFLKLLKEEH